MFAQYLRLVGRRSKWTSAVSIDALVTRLSRRYAAALEVGRKAGVIKGTIAGVTVAVSMAILYCTYALAFRWRLCEETLPMTFFLQLRHDSRH